MAIRNLNHFFNSNNCFINKPNPRIYVACVPASDAGYVHVCSIDPMQGFDKVIAKIKQMLSKSPTPNANDWAIYCAGNLHDFLWAMGEHVDHAKKTTETLLIVMVENKYEELIKPTPA